MAGKLGVAPNYFTSFVDGQGAGASTYVTYASDLDTNFVAIKASFNDMVDEINAVNGTNFLVSLDTVQYSDGDNGLFGIQQQGVLGGHSYAVVIDGDPTKLTVQKGQMFAQAQRGKSDSVVTLTGSGGSGTRWVALDSLGIPSLEVTAGAQALDVISVNWNGTQFTGTLTQIAHIFFDGDEYSRMRYRPDDGAIWATGGTPVLASHKAFRLFSDRMQAVERLVTGRNTETDATALPVMGFAGTAALPGIVPTDGAGVRDTSTGLFRAAADAVGFSASGVATINFQASGILAIVGTLGAPSYSFLTDPDTGMFHSNADTVDFAAGGNQSLRVVANGIRVPVGIATTPSYSFLGDTGTGVFRPAAGQVGFTTVGTERARISSAGIQSVVLGTAAAPSYSWTTDDDTGMFRKAVDTIGFSNGGVEVLTVSAGGILVPNGTALLPSIAFISDVDTGIYTPGVNRLSFATAGLQRVEIDANGSCLFSTGTAVVPSLAFISDPNTGMFNVVNTSLSFVVNGVEIFQANGGGVDVLVGALGLPAGSAAVPSLAFVGDPNTGLFNVADMSLSAAINGTEVLRVDGTGIKSVPVGTAAVPSFSFTADPDTGMFSLGADRLGFATAGVLALELDATQHALFTDGTAAAPSISFIGDPDTGLFSQAGNSLGISTLGVERVRVTSAFAVRAVSGSIAALNGSDSAPSITFANDVDTGFFDIGASDRLGIATGGVTRAEFDAEGNLDLPTNMRAIVRRAVDQTITDVTTTNIAWDTEDTDIGGWITVTSENLTVPTGGDGTYLITLAVRWEETGSGANVNQRQIQIEVGGSVFGVIRHDASASGLTRQATSTVVELVATDVVHGQVLQDSGFSMDIDTARLTITKIA